MTYRGELEAAMERVRVLEQAIIEIERDTRRSDRQALVEENAALRRSLSDAKAEVDAMKAMIQPPGPGLLTVDEHNRNQPPQTKGWDLHRAGVLCPRCRAAGEDVELLRGPNQWADRGYGDVRCPRCLHHDWMKFPPAQAR